MWRVRGLRGVPWARLRRTRRPYFRAAGAVCASARAGVPPQASVQATRRAGPHWAVSQERCATGRGLSPAARGFPATQPAQGVHELVPVLLLVLHFPSGQARQELRPFVGAYVPAGQGSQFPWPLSRSVEPEPPLLYLPAAQLVQELAPDPLYLPAAQGAQSPSPLSKGVEPEPPLLYLPAPQKEQEVTALVPDLYLPPLPAQSKLEQSHRNRSKDTSPMALVCKGY